MGLGLSGSSVAGEIDVRVTCMQTSTATTDTDGMLTMNLKHERRRALRDSDT